MVFKFVKYVFIALGILLTGFKGSSQPYEEESHVMVAMRMIGHQILLHTGDSTSRVLPIKKIDDRYQIEFENNFEFTPDEIVKIINDVVIETKIAPRYLVQIENCETKEVEYSYEVDLINQSDIIPCRTRAQPTSCYAIFFTVLEAKPDTFNLSSDSLFVQNRFLTNDPQESKSQLLWLLIPVLIIGASFWYWKSKTKLKTDPEIIRIGQYRFDKLNMQLSFKNKTTELSSKEADLLFLLYTSVNTIIERQNILKEVWGDEGDYVGRTMDVFISKLRKKLADDTNLKIINIRGVGYKFVVNG